ncbi:hypothetical protein B4U79_10362, partial [Dinothrombium tinctorium]
MRKESNQKPAGPLQPFSAIAVDYYSKYAVTKAITSASAEEVADFFVKELVLKFGSPKKILSDRGTAFWAKLTETIFSLVSIKQVKTTTYHPETN